MSGTNKKLEANLGCVHLGKHKCDRFRLPTKPFAFGFKKKSASDFLNFSFSLLNEKPELVKFIDGEKNPHS